MDPEPLDPKASADLGSGLARIEGLEARRLIATGSKPQPRSRGSEDEVSPHARYVIAFAGMALAGAVDHLATWRLVVQSGPIPIYSSMTLLRGAFEAAVLVRWLVDRRAGTPERVGRGIAAQLVDYEERGKFEDAAKAPGEWPPGMGKSARARHADVVAHRKKAGIPIIPMLGATALAQQFGVPGHSDRRWLYRLMSAFAHAKPWALHGTQLGPATPYGTGGVMQGHVTSSDIVIVGTTSIVIDHVDTALADFEEYLGLSWPHG